MTSQFELIDNNENVKERQLHLMKTFFCFESNYVGMPDAFVKWIFYGITLFWGCKSSANITQDADVWLGMPV